MSSSTGKMIRSRNRNYVLGGLLPKAFGIIAQRGGDLHGYGGCSALTGQEVIVSGSPLDSHRVMLSVYFPLQSNVTKVFSAHVTNAPHFGNSAFYRHLDGCVGLMNWRRGDWEQVILADPAGGLSLSDAFLRGIFEARTAY